MAKISWAGHSCFQISVSPSKEVSANIVIDPFSEEASGLKLPKFKADVLLISHQHDDHNNIKGVLGDPFVIESPGEYDIKEIFIQGINSFHDAERGKERGRNTIYTIESEDIKFCHLGDIGQNSLDEEQLEKIGSVDILMIPVGGTYTISSLEAQKIVSQIEPKIVIPMHYALPKLKYKLDDVTKFLKAMGKGQVTPTDKFTVKAKDLPKEGAMEIIILKP